MRMNLKFQSLFMALLMVMLIFSHPFVILAQQNSVESQAKIAAERDAETDVNKLSWNGAGLFLGAAWSLIGVSIVINNSVEVSEDTRTCMSCLFSELDSDLQRAWTVGVIGCIGLSCGLSLLTAIDITRSSNPPPERLIGKSPEYVDFYINAYRAKAQRLKGSSAIIGAAAAAGCGLVLIGLTHSVLKFPL